MSKHSHIHPVLLGLLILGSYTPAAFSSDHPISIVNAVAYVTRQSVLIRAEVLAEDLTLFHPIEPDDMDIYSVDQLKWAMNQHKDFLTKKLIVRDADGEKIPAKFHNLEPFEFPGIGVPAGDLMKYPAYYELEFFFAEPPEFLTFEQNIIDDLTLLPSEVKLGVKQSGNETGQGFVLTPGNPETARFDWNQPPLSDEASDEEWLKLRTQQENDVLGITSYSSPYSFIYITPHEVRHEVLVPLAILARTFEIERQNISFLEVQEQDNARPRIEAFLQDNNPVKIDGVIVQPIFDRIDFYGLRLKDFAMQSERKRISMANGRVGVIMRYPAKTPPRTVSVVWDLFPPQIRKVEAVIVAPDKVEKFQFTKIKKLKSDEDNNLNEFVWHNSKDAQDFTIAKIPFDYQRKRYSFSVMTVTAGLLLIFSAVVLYLSRSSAKIQLGSLVVWILVGSLGWNFTIIKVDDPFEPQFSVSGEEADRIVSSLVTNVYRAFDYNDESEIYDAIAQSADGKLLKDIYLSVQKTRQMQQQGGALTEINRVEFLDGQKKKDADSNGFDYQCTWVVNGTVEHWGHIHERTNQFTADLTIEPVDKAWRIVRREIVDAQQSSKTELRRLDPKG